MKKSIKNLEVKTVKNIKTVKGGNGGNGSGKPKQETTTLGDISALAYLP